MFRIGWALGLLTLATAFQAAPAQAGFAPSDDPVVSAEQLSASGLAMDAEGNSIVAWSREGAVAGTRVVEARRIAADGAAGPAFDLAPGEQGFDPVVAMTPQGRAFVAWRSQTGEPGDPNGVKGRWIEPNGILGPLVTIADAEADAVNSSYLSVVVDPSGVAAAAWIDQGTNRLQIRRIGPDSSLGPLLPDVSDGFAERPQIAALPNGSTVAVWVGAGIEKNVVTGGDQVGVPETVSESAGSEAWPELGVDSQGNGYAAWRLSEAGAPETYSFRARRLDASGAAVGEELLVDPPQKEFPLIGVRVVPDTAGDFLVQWARQNAKGEYVVYGRSLDGAGQFLSTTQPLSDAPGQVAGYEAALFDSGAAASVWGLEVGATDTTFGRELGFPSLAGGGVQSLFSAVRPQLVASAPAIGAAAFLIYYPISGSAQVAELRRFLLPPTCLDGWVVATKDAPIQVPADCSGAGIESVQVFAAPRFGTLGPYDPATGTLTYTPRRGNVRNDTFTYAAANDGGSSNPVTVTVRDRVRPRLFSLRLLRTKKRPRVFRVRMVASEPVRPRIVVQRRLPGILKGRRCVKARSRAQLKTKVRCLRFHKVGVVQKKGFSRRWRVRLPRKLQRQFRHGGGFRVVATGIDRAHNKRTKRINVNT